MKIKMIDQPFKPNPKIICPFDKYPCSRPLSIIDNHLQCGGVYAFGSTMKNGYEEELFPSCPRLNKVK